MLDSPFVAIWGLLRGKGPAGHLRTAQVVFVVVPPVISGGSVDTLRAATDISVYAVRGDLVERDPRHRRPGSLPSGPL